MVQPSPGSPRRIPSRLFAPPTSYFTSAMFEESPASSPFSTNPSSPMSALVPLSAADPDPEGWQRIAHAQTQVVLYNPASHALSVRPQALLPAAPEDTPTRHPTVCPYCARPLDEAVDHGVLGEEDIDPHEFADNYFELLEIANEAWSRPSSPAPSLGTSESSRDSRRREDTREGFGRGSMAEGYFSTFFKEEQRLGMGASGSVYLCQHVMNGNLLGRFAVKKIAVGDSHSYLGEILREVRLLEQLRHPNIVTYHHSWLEECQFSSFGPRIPTLHVLMQWAELGSLDDFISDRLGGHHTANEGPSTPSGPRETRSARIRAFRAARTNAQTGQPPLQRRRDPAWRTVHLTSAEEAASLLRDVVEGLSFLHDKSIWHLDLKPGNVLLTLDEGRLIPRAMLSDFGTSRDGLNSLPRSGNTGTLEYAAPESIRSPLTPLDSKADMWALGMLLHKLLFFRLPYAATMDAELTGPLRLERLEDEILAYPGFEVTPGIEEAFRSRRLGPAYIFLLKALLARDSIRRPSCRSLIHEMRKGVFDPISVGARVSTPTFTALTPAPPRISHSSRQGSPEHTPPSSRMNEHEGKASNLAPGLDDADTNRQHTPRPPGLERKMLAGIPEALPSTEEMRPSAIIATAIPGSDRVHILSARCARACILVAKVLTLSHTCTRPNGQLHQGVAAMALGAGILDAMQDSWRASTLFGLAHLALLRWGNVWCL